MPKGDALCPLGFHPQVRWPTRCKRCFRDYKDHGAKKEDSNTIRRDDITSSTPSLTGWRARFQEKNELSAGSHNSSSPSSNAPVSYGDSSSSRSRSNLDLDVDDGSLGRSDISSYTATSPLTRLSSFRPTTSWTSTPDLNNLNDETQASAVQAQVTAHFTLPRRRQITASQSSDDSAVSSQSASRSDSSNSTYPRRRTTDLTDYSSSSSPNSDSARSNSSADSRRRVRIQSFKEVKSLEEPTNPDVEFIIQVKSTPKFNSAKKSKPSTSTPPSYFKPATGGRSSSDDESDDDDRTSVTATEITSATDTTLVDAGDEAVSDLQLQLESLRSDLEVMRQRAEKAERERSELLLRRVAAMETTPSRTAASEVLNLQKKVNEFQSLNEDLQDEQRSLQLRVGELEAELRASEELKVKLKKTEKFCNDLLQEKEQLKREMQDMEEEIDEMQDNFRENEADEYSNIKKELEQTAKNCRILQFKLRKAERRSDTLEAEKIEADRRARDMAGGAGELDRAAKIKSLEQELSVGKEVSNRLLKEVEQLKEQLKVAEEAAAKKDTKTVKGKKEKEKEKEKEKKDDKTKPVLTSTPSFEKASRASLTRGHSQDDPAQLLRDLQDTLERETDLKEQMRFAEEEADMLRKKLSRVEEDNESLVLQLKKMATKARSGRKPSPGPGRLTSEPSFEKDEGISDDLEDITELKLQLELNEQESGVLRRKVEDLESERESLRKEVRELSDRLSSEKSQPATKITAPEPSKANAYYEQKIQVLEEEASELRKKLIEKDRENERLQTDLVTAQKSRGKGSLQRSRSLDSDQTLDLKRQLQIIEQEATILRTKTHDLEAENEKLATENRRLVLKTGRNDAETLKEKVKDLEKKLSEANDKVKELTAKASEKPSTVVPKATTAELEKLKKDLKSKSDEFDKVKVQLTKLEKDNEKNAKIIDKLKDATNYKTRTPKKPTDMTTKLQMKKMVDELEQEIGELYVVMKKTEEEKLDLLKESNNKSKMVDESIVEELKTKIGELTDKQSALEKELKTEKEKAEKAEKDKKKTEKEKKKLDDEKKKGDEEKKKYESEKKKIEEENKKLVELKSKLEEEKKKLEAKLEEEKKKLEANLDEDKKKLEAKLDEEKKKLEAKLEEEKQKFQSEKKKLEDEVKKLQNDKASLSGKKDEMKVFIDRIETLKKDLSDEREQGALLRKQLEDKATKESERQKLQKELDEEKSKVRKAEDACKETSATSLKEKNDLQQQVEDLREKIKEKDSQVQQLENNLKESEANQKKSEKDSKDLKSIKQESDSLKTQLQETKQKLEKAEKLRKSSEDKHSKAEAEIKKDLTQQQAKVKELNNEIQEEKKKLDKQQKQFDVDMGARDRELSALRDQLRSMQQSGSAAQTLAAELSAARQDFEDLCSKYELLEEEHVAVKAQIVMEREAIDREMMALQGEHETVTNELQTLRQTFNQRQDSWIREKLDLQEKVKELEEKALRGASDTWLLEKARMKNVIEEKTSRVELLEKEASSVQDQVLSMKQEIEELRHKLDDYEKVNKVQRSLSADASAKDAELKDLRNKLAQEEKNHRTEISTTKMRYDSRVALIGEELQTAQQQAAKFRRERDTLRSMLDGAQKNLSELKSGRSRGTPAEAAYEAEAARQKAASLEQQMVSMEDELTDARLQISKLKNELMGERSAWEVKISELQSHLNEVEEDRLISSGRTKIPGLRTRMELAWHKEREEQQRLLQETSTLARDLRQTLFEVERERDKERVEGRRRFEQLKKAMDEEQDENRKKITELQYDLLELRDAHAKLRTTNEKLRRDRERVEKERDDSRSSTRRLDSTDSRVVALIEQVESLNQLVPTIFQKIEVPSEEKPKPLAPKRIKGPKSRESSPSLEKKETKDLQLEVQAILQRVTEMAAEIKKGVEEGERDVRSRRGHIRRAASSEEPDDSSRWRAAGLSPLPRGPPHMVSSNKRNSLYRKSLSLEQTSSGPPDQNIWKPADEGSNSSLQSLEMGAEAADPRFLSLQRQSRGTSLDRGSQGSSAQSDIVLPVGGELKKKKGLFGKLKQLTKSRSIDDGGSEYVPATSSIGSGSDISDVTSSKPNLKSKIGGIFRKNPSSRGSSVERPVAVAVKETSHSQQRPLSRNEASSRASPARSDISQSSTTSMSRPLAPSKRIMGRLSRQNSDETDV